MLGIVCHVDVESSLSRLRVESVGSIAVCSSAVSSTVAKVVIEPRNVFAWSVNGFMSVAGYNLSIICEAFIDVL